MDTYIFFTERKPGYLQVSDKDLTISLLGEEFCLIGEKAIHWPSKELVIVSDVHLGKAGHFRKNGIPISSEIHLDDLNRLTHIITRYPCKTMIFLGDLFHSDYNAEWQHFLDWINQYDDIEFILVKGNHDVMPDQHYLSGNLRIVEYYEVRPFCFTHEKIDSDLYNLSGHIHPGVNMVGAGKQRVKIPCFYFSDFHGVLPAFGNFTGNHTIRPRSTDQVFGIINGRVIDLFSQNNSILSK